MSLVTIPRAPSPTAMIPWVAALVIGAAAHLGWFLHDDAAHCPRTPLRDGVPHREQVLVISSDHPASLRNSHSAP